MVDLAQVQLLQKFVHRGLLLGHDGIDSVTGKIDSMYVEELRQKIPV